MGLVFFLLFTSSHAQPVDIETVDFNLETRLEFQEGTYVRDFTFSGDFLFVATEGSVNLHVFRVNNDGSYELQDSTGVSRVAAQITIVDNLIVTHSPSTIAVLSFNETTGELTKHHDESFDNPIFDTTFVKDGADNYTLYYTTGIRESTILVKYHAYLGKIHFNETFFTESSVERQDSWLTGKSHVMTIDGTILALFDDLIIHYPDNTNQTIETVNNDRINTHQDFHYDGEYLYWLSEFSAVRGQPSENQLFKLPFPSTNLTTEDVIAYLNVTNVREVTTYENLIMVAQQQNGTEVISRDVTTGEPLGTIFNIPANISVIAVEMYGDRLLISDGHRLDIMKIGQRQITTSTLTSLPDTSESRNENFGENSVSPLDYPLQSTILLVIPLMLSRLVNRKNLN